MNIRRISIIALTIVLIIAVFTGVVTAIDANPRLETRLALENVRAYAPAITADTPSYAVDAGVLFQGEPGNWLQVNTPQDVIVSAVAFDSANPEIVYIGAANELVVYRTDNGGSSWMNIPLTSEHIGGVTDIAVDSAQRLIYVGTDTAGVFRLRDVGTSVINSGQLLLDRPVLDVAADSTGAGMAFARTEWALYRAENFGLSWVVVDNLQSVPTALEIANTSPATVYVGTMDRGVLQSSDGMTWELANQGLNFVPGSRLHVNDLAIDPQQPDVLYVATSYLYGTTTANETPAGVAMSTDGAQAWANLIGENTYNVAELMPVSGQTGSVYALTTDSRAPLALGEALPAPAVADTAVAAAPTTGFNFTGLMSWVIAALAGMALLYAIVSDLRSRQPVTRRTLAPAPEAIRSNR
jgi:photosystem II stability/assembly factor-like uncharacterized protein